MVVLHGRRDELTQCAPPTCWPSSSASARSCSRSPHGVVLEDPALTTHTGLGLGGDLPGNVSAHGLAPRDRPTFAPGHYVAARSQPPTRSPTRRPSSTTRRAGCRCSRPRERPCPRRGRLPRALRPRHVGQHEHEDRGRDPDRHGPGGPHAPRRGDPAGGLPVALPRPSRPGAGTPAGPSSPCPSAPWSGPP